MKHFVVSILIILALAGWSQSAVVVVSSQKITPGDISSSVRSKDAFMTHLAPLLPPHGIQNVEEIWETCLTYLAHRDILGLWEYIRSLPETWILLAWLERYVPDLFEAVCWIFDACGGHDIEIPPEVIQKILSYIQRNDWEGLVGYMETLEYYEYLLEWIHYNFPDAWLGICPLINRC